MKPSLFVFEEYVIDLSKISLIAKRDLNPGYYLQMQGCTSLGIRQEAGDAIRTAWIAFTGKFDPAKDR